MIKDAVEKASRLNLESIFRQEREPGKLLASRPALKPFTDVRQDEQVPVASQQQAFWLVNRDDYFGGDA